MRTRFRVALAAVAVGALTVATAAPAGAQEEPAPLGFAVDKTQAQPGALVLGKVDTDDVAEHCTITVEGIQADMLAWVEEVLAPQAEGDVWETFFPDTDVLPGPNDFENFDQAAYAAVVLLAAGVALDLQGAAQTFLDQTFVMTFADVATQDPVGELGSFDPDTGEGSVIVPDITPGLWAVAGACITPTFDEPTVIAGMEAGGDYLESLGIPLNDLPISLGQLDELVAFLEEHGPTLVQPLVVPRAFGAVLFCILDDQGNCPADEEPPPPPGEQIGPGGEAGPAQAVTAAPSFTG